MAIPQENHPLDLYFKALLDRERQKPIPQIRIAPEYYDFPVARYRDDMGPDGELKRTLVMPGQGEEEATPSSGH